MPQILKNMIRINFLYEAYQFFKKEKNKKGSIFSEMYKFYEKEINFINFFNETVLIILFYGKIDSFKELENNLKIGNDLSDKSDDIFDSLKN